MTFPISKSFVASSAILIFSATPLSAAPVFAGPSPTCAVQTSCPVAISETKKKPVARAPKPRDGGIRTTGGAVELTAQECERLGGTVTPNGDPNCKSNQRCYNKLPNGDLRSICIDEVQ